MNRKPPKKAHWHYAPWGPGARCWCGIPMYSPEDECRGCVADYEIWKQLKVIPEEDIIEAQQKAQNNDDDWEEEGPDDGLPPSQPKIIYKEPEDEDPNIPRNGWGIPLSRENYDEWPSYTSQTIVDIGSQTPEESKT